MPSSRSEASSQQRKSVVQSRSPTSLYDFDPFLNCPAIQDASLPLGDQLPLISIPESRIPSPLAPNIAPNTLIDLKEFLLGRANADNEFAGCGVGGPGTGITVEGQEIKGGEEVWESWKRAWDIWNNHYIEGRVNPVWIREEYERLKDAGTASSTSGRRGTGRFASNGGMRSRDDRAPGGGRADGLGHDADNPHANNTTTSAISAEEPAKASDNNALESERGDAKRTEDEDEDEDDIQAPGYGMADLEGEREEVESAPAPPKERSVGFYAMKDLEDYEVESGPFQAGSAAWEDRIQNSVWRPRHVGERVLKLDLDEPFGKFFSRKELRVDGGVDCGRSPHPLLRSDIIYTETVEEDPDTKSTLSVFRKKKIWDEVTGTIFNMPCLPVEYANGTEDEQLLRTKVVYGDLMRDNKFEWQNPGVFPLDIRRVRRINAATMAPVIGAAAYDSTVETVFLLNDASPVSTRHMDPKDPWWVTGEQKNHRDMPRRRQPLDPKRERDNAYLPIDDTNWREELALDQTREAEYFVTNLHGGTLVVNGVEITKGFIAGPLPRFAVIESPGGQVSFWWGVGGRSLGQGAEGIDWTSHWNTLRQRPGWRHVGRLAGEVWISRILDRLSREKKGEDEDDDDDEEWNIWKSARKDESIASEVAMLSGAISENSPESEGGRTPDSCLIFDTDDAELNYLYERKMIYAQQAAVNAVDISDDALKDASGWGGDEKKRRGSDEDDSAHLRSEENLSQIFLKSIPRQTAIAQDLRDRKARNEGLERSNFEATNKKRQSDLVQTGTAKKRRVEEQLENVTEIELHRAAAESKAIETVEKQTHDETLKRFGLELDAMWSTREKEIDEQQAAKDPGERDEPQKLLAKKLDEWAVIQNEHIQERETIQRILVEQEELRLGEGLPPRMPAPEPDSDELKMYSDRLLRERRDRAIMLPETQNTDTMRQTAEVTKKPSKRKAQEEVEQVRGAAGDAAGKRQRLGESEKWDSEKTRQSGHEKKGFEGSQEGNKSRREHVRQEQVLKEVLNKQPGPQEREKKRQTGPFSLEDQRPEKRPTTRTTRADAKKQQDEFYSSLQGPEKALVAKWEAIMGMRVAVVTSEGLELTRQAETAMTHDQKMEWITELSILTSETGMVDFVDQKTAQWKAAEKEHRASLKIRAQTVGLSVSDYVELQGFSTTAAYLKVEMAKAQPIPEDLSFTSVWSTESMIKEAEVHLREAALAGLTAKCKRSGETPMLHVQKLGFPDVETYLQSLAVQAGKLPELNLSNIHTKSSMPTVPGISIDDESRKTAVWKSRNLKEMNRIRWKALCKHINDLSFWEDQIANLPDPGVSGLGEIDHYGKRYLVV